MPHTVLIARDFDHLSDLAADATRERIARTLEQQDTFNLGLATGHSPTGAYRRLIQAFNRRAIPAEKVRTFNLDEYVGLPGADAQARVLHPESYTYFMIQELFGPLHPKFAATHLPAGCLIDQPTLEGELDAHPGDWKTLGADNGQAIRIHYDAASAYLQWIRQDILRSYLQAIDNAGGIDLHLIGIGKRGHVAFHEVGIPFQSDPMLLVKLDDDTIECAIQAGHFTSRQASPRFAISMSAELIFRARAVILLATGASKAAPIAASLLEDPSPAIPASYAQIYAQRGGDITYLLDLDAAADVLAHRDAITARGIHIQNLT